MPYRTEWVQPEVFLEYKDVTIYRVYREEEEDEAMTYWFTTSLEADPDRFDVRDLPVEGDAETEDGRKQRIKAAINKRWITQEGCRKRATP